ncbi:MAG: UPF0149 family protein [Deltaproteobacteria bacterium]|nr:UPF0149 family protein [Deltaproteobacteria bacterium]
MPRARAVCIELEVTLRGIYPRVFRCIRVPAGITLGDLHRVLQIAFEWRDERHHRFTLGARTFDARDEEGILLASHVVAKTYLSYEYDPQAGWQHDIVVARVDAPSRASGDPPLCTAGARAAPPEDTGGPWGYMATLGALEDPRHPDHDAHVAWLGVGWDPDRFDIDLVNDRLAAVFAPRAPARSPGKSKVATATTPSLATPLSRDEAARLAALLDERSEFDPSGILGLLHAVGTAPSEIPHATWIEHAFPRGVGGATVAETQLRVSLLLRHHHEVVTALSAGGVIAPAPDEVLACRSFASGYVEGASLDATWWADARLRIHLLHHAYLARRFDLVHPVARAKLEEDGDPDARICEMLGGLVAGAYEAIRASAGDERRV